MLVIKRLWIVQNFAALPLREAQARTVRRLEKRCQELMQAITIWVIAQGQRNSLVHCRVTCPAGCLISFSVAAWKRRARGRWIGWSSERQYGHVKPLASKSRFFVLPG